MSNASLPLPERPEREPETGLLGPSEGARLRRLVDEHHAFVWRSIRRLGVAEPDVDDAVQKVFVVVSRRLGEIEATRERSFLFATSVRVAANERRAQGRRLATSADDLDALVDPAAPSPERAVGHRMLLDRLLEPLDVDLRSVFVLFELEQMTKEEVAVTLDIPAGTVASRLRRARELVQGAAARVAAREGGGR